VRAALKRNMDATHLQDAVDKASVAQVPDARHMHAHIFTVHVRPGNCIRLPVKH